MTKIAKFIPYLYLAFAILFITTAIYEFNTDRNRAYLMFAVSGLALFMFFFKRRFNRKFENRK